MLRHLPVLAVLALLAGCASSQAARVADSTASAPTSAVTSGRPTSASPAHSRAHRRTHPRAHPRTRRTPARTTPVRTTPARTTPPRTTPPRTTQAPTSRPAPTPVPHHTVVVLDPGHNGANASHPEIINQLVPAGYGRYKPCNTTGTSTDAGFPEHAFTWDVALRVRALLLQHGITVVLTRPSDTGVGPCVNERAAIGNQAGAAAVVSIHGDGSVTGHGFHVITDAGEPAGAAIAAASQRLAVDVHGTMLAYSGLTTATYIGADGYDRRSDLAGLNLSVRPTIMVECGNMRDPGDATIMSSPEGRQRIATGLAAGILQFIG